MRLLILRHAKAEKAPPGMPDRDRDLTKRGRKDSATVGAYLARHKLIPGRALVSPATRTRATFEHLVAEWPKAPAVAYENRLYDARADAILAIIRAAGTSAPTLLVIGHNPGLHEAARLLIAAGDVDARERLNEGMPTSGLAVIDFAGTDWRELHPQGGRLERFVSPRSLAAAAD